MQHIVSLSGDCDMQRTPVNAGSVEWSGENPGIYLKENPDGDYSVVALFFRIVYHHTGGALAPLSW